MFCLEELVADELDDVIPRICKKKKNTKLKKRKLTSNQPDDFIKLARSNFCENFSN